MNKLAGAAVVTLLLLAIPTQETRETRETQETSTQETSETSQRYADVTAWCDARFPYRDDLQEACKWGAYEMLPGQDVPVLPEEGTQDA